MNRFENGQFPEEFDPASGLEPRSKELLNSANLQESMINTENKLINNLEGLEQDLKEINPSKLTTEDTNELRSQVKKIMPMIYALAGMATGTIEGIRSLSGVDISNEQGIGAILATISGGLSLLQLIRQRRNNNQA